MQPVSYMECVLLLLQLLMLNTGSECVVVQQLSTREPAVAGRAMQLECLWSEGSGPPLYSMRWCKDGAQFFVVTLIPEPRKTVFSVPGIQVMVGASNEHLVTLTNVTATTSGTFSCEAMSDAPAFFSSALSTHINVLEVPAAGPNWRGLLSMYHLDQQLVAHCHVYSSRPPAVFTIFVNDHLVTKQSGWHFWNPPVEQRQESVWNSSSTLSIPLTLQNIQQLFPKEKPKYTLIEPTSESGTNLSQYEPEPTWLSDPQRYYTFPSGLLLSSSHTQHTSPFPSRSKSVHMQGSSSPINTMRLNLTCVAEVGQLTFKTTTWSSVNLPVVVHSGGLTGSSGNAGLQAIPYLIMHSLSTLYCMGSNGYIT